MSDRTDGGAGSPDLRSIAIRTLRLLERFPVDILQLMFRIAIAVVFFRSGLTKIATATFQRHIKSAPAP